MQVTTKTVIPHSSEECRHSIRAVHDAMYVLGGKWKISIVACLLFGAKRYSDILREVEGISGKMLSRELKEMEVNFLVKRTVGKSQPVMVSYELTEYGESVKPVIATLANWGQIHRQCVAKR
ncbi:winged helix-turn-helix transcriptional regulator [Paenimyroides baculatum]|uniref:Helix-turn-helix transcriptional regulator n=1 Tax=Paenimyroides baculatum TaxID=2608000 RepID=A0A5M6CKR7_9FLAO|nr:helix-turn-helix domain-containing protein [Paenimyroides baculatum]KAA5535724.1 helix-turn-helix transcriptional regulator [Paenimyroides baculatum]